MEVKQYTNYKYPSEFEIVRLGEFYALKHNGIIIDRSINSVYYEVESFMVEEFFDKDVELYKYRWALGQWELGLFGDDVIEKMESEMNLKRNTKRLPEWAKALLAFGLCTSILFTLMLIFL